MSQTDTKSKKSTTSAAAEKPPAGAASQKTGGNQASGGSQGLVYLVVLVVLAAVVAAFFLGNGGDEGRPVASAAVEEESSAESAAAAAGESDTVSLIIDSNVRGADVFLNGNRVGTTPHKATPLTPGDYEVRVEHDGYVAFKDSVRVETPDGAIHATLRPASAESNAGKEDASEKAPVAESGPASADIRGSGQRVAVNHNHRIGSCEGVLIAGNEGVRFETEHKDAFTAAYAEIEELSFDDDKLTLKVLNGRKYDFNEQNDDAEALAALHAQVAAKTGPANE